MKKMLRLSVALVLILALLSSVAFAQMGMVTDGQGFSLFDESGVMLRTNRSATGSKGMVSAPKYEAAKIGIDILEAGGNAFDAAVAVGFAVGVVEPNSSGLGGGGFITCYDAKSGKTTFIDFRERAPKHASPAMWVVDEETGKVIGGSNGVGGLASGVPGDVAGFLYTLEKYGTMTREQVIRPAIDLASGGFVVTPTLGGDIKNNYDAMVAYPALGKVYLTPDGFPYEVGETLVNKDICNTFEKIIAEGRDGFYKGPIAEAIVRDVNKYGGLFTMKDLEDYDVIIREPVKGTYRDYQVISSPLASSGGTIIIEILNILENYDLSAMGDNSADYIHMFSEAFKMAYADRAMYMGDPEYVDVPITGLLSKDYAKKLAQKIDPAKAQTYTCDDPWLYEHEDTTHFSIVDKDGNMVACTKSVNGIFGSKVVVDGYGFVMNNTMADFSTDPTSVNAVAGGKEPLSSMSPTIVMDPDGKPFAVLGSPGGTTIIAAVSQVISRMVDFGLSAEEAVNSPRFSDNTSAVIKYENLIDQAVIDKLVAMGHEVESSDAWNRSFGSVQAVKYEKDGTISGASDPRRDGKSIGY
ncbi:MAG: gamma-glutamyltransferase [Clostridia bacterium]